MHKRGDKPRFNKRQYFTMPIERVVEYYGLKSVRDDMQALIMIVKLAKQSTSSLLTMTFGDYGNFVLTAEGYERKQQLKAASRLGTLVKNGKQFVVRYPINLKEFEKREREFNQYLVNHVNKTEKV